MLLFFDTSALVKRYVKEAGTTWTNSLFDPQSSHVFYLARIAAVEFTAAICRRSRGGTLPAANAAKALRQFRAELPHRYLLIEITQPLLQDAERLAEKHALRAYDAVQLAALSMVDQYRKQYSLPPLMLISADAELLQAATAEGFATDDPNQHP